MRLPEPDVASRPEACLPFDAFDLGPGERERRFTLARRRGRRAWLWPEVGPAEWRTCLRAIGDVVAQLLADDAAAPVLDPQLTGGERALSLAAYTSGTGPLLGWWIEQGRLSARPEHARVLELHLRHARLRAARTEGILLPLIDSLSDAGIGVGLLKGAHTARVYFPEPALRPSADIDVVIGAAAMRAAGDRLGSLGWIRGPSQRRPRRETWQPPGQGAGPRSVWLAHAEDPIEMDLHASLDRNVFGVRRIRFDRAVARDGWCAVNASGLSIRVLPEHLLLLYLACHASEGLHHLTLLRLVELIRVARHAQACGRLDWGDVAESASQLGCERFSYPAFILAESLAPGFLPRDLRRQLEGHATPALRRVTAELDPATAQRIDRVSLEERLMWARGPIEHARRMLHALWPPEAGWSVVRGIQLWAGRAWTLLGGGFER